MTRHSYPSALRIGLSLAAIALVGIGTAQISGRDLNELARNRAQAGQSTGVETSYSIKPSSITMSAAPTAYNTRTVFPQIQQEISQREITPENPDRSRPVPPGSPNNLVAAMMGGPSQITRGARFPGMTQTGWIPPDPQIAAGPDHIVQVVNSDIAFFVKSTGQQTFQQSLGPNGFFQGTGVTNFVFDPKVYYDQGSGRFFVVVLHLNQGQRRSDVMIAVSDDSDPHGTWFRYIIDTKQTMNSVEYWLDYPGWGYNRDGVMVTGNMFGFSSGSNGSTTRILDKAPMLAGQTTTVTLFEDPSSFTIQPARTLESDTNYIYAVAQNTTTSLKVFAAKDILSETPTLEVTTVGVPSYQGVGPAESAGGRLLDTIPVRIMDATARDGRLLAAHTVRSSAGRAAVRWYEFSVNNWPEAGNVTVAQAGNIELPNGEHAFQPAISINRFYDISILFTRSSQNIAADVAVSSRKATDPAGVISAPEILVSSVGTAGGGGVNRWGDYFAVCIDPNDDTTFWGNGQIIGGSGQWQTWIDSWVITPPGDGGGGGGGGGAGRITPSSISTFLGKFVSGDVTSVQASDQVFYNVDSELQAGVGQFAAAQMTFETSANPDAVNRLTIEVDVLIDPGFQATGTIFAWNYNTSQWDYVRAFRLNTVQSELFAAQTSTTASDYVSPTGQVQVIVRGHAPFRRVGLAPVPFRLRIDEAAVRIN